jgi:hypothetical protein
MLEHEDNEMMRPYVVVGASSNLSLEIAVAVIVVAAVIAVSVVLYFKRSRRHTAKP